MYAEKNALSEYSLDQITGSDIAYCVWLVKSLIFLIDHKDHSFIAPFQLRYYFVHLGRFPKPTLLHTAMALLRVPTLVIYNYGFKLN